MSSETYKVWFKGEIASGYTLDQAKHNLHKLFRCHESQIEEMFSGKQVILQQSVDKQTALKYKTAIEKAGGICHLELLSASPQTGSPTFYNVVLSGEIQPGKTIHDRMEYRNNSVYLLMPPNLFKLRHGNRISRGSGIAAMIATNQNERSFTRIQF
jgi:hypothetical protein